MEKQKKMALTEEEKSINIVDLFIYLIAHWKWFVLSILLFGGYFWYSYCETPFVYSRTAIVMIKTPANSRSAMQLNNADFIGQVNVASEILQFKSKELMRKVIAAKEKSDLRQNDYYRYDKYQRITFGFNNITQHFIDSSFLRKYPLLVKQVEFCPQTQTNILPLTYNETSSEHIYRKQPEAERNFIRGTNSEGLNELFATGTS